MSKKYVVDPKGNVFELGQFAALKDGWREATSADIKACEERTRPRKAAPTLLEPKPAPVAVEQQPAPEPK